jgi:hypothetical protein
MSMRNTALPAAMEAAGSAGRLAGSRGPVMGMNTPAVRPQPERMR